MRGTVNGLPALFLVDPGASMVSVSSAFARRAGLQGGTPMAFRTANGRIEGRVISGVDVMAGTMYVTGVDVVVGVADEDQVLLGQSFLRYFEITMDARQMVMKYKGQ
jgi:aspartyl protease family protein